MTNNTQDDESINWQEALDSLFESTNEGNAAGWEVELVRRRVQASEARVRAEYAELVIILTYYYTAVEAYDGLKCDLDHGVPISSEVVMDASNCVVGARIAVRDALARIAKGA